MWKSYNTILSNMSFKQICMLLPKIYSTNPLSKKGHWINFLPENAKVRQVRTNIKEIILLNIVFSSWKSIWSIGWFDVTRHNLHVALGDVWSLAGELYAFSTISNFYFYCHLMAAAIFYGCKMWNFSKCIACGLYWCILIFVFTMLSSWWY